MLYVYKDKYNQVIIVHEDFKLDKEPVMIIEDDEKPIPEETDKVAVLKLDGNRLYYEYIEIQKEVEETEE